MAVPEIRLDGFDGDWSEVTVGDLSTTNNGRDYKHLSPGNIPVYGTGGYMTSVDEALATNDDAIGIGRKGTIDRPYILRAPFWTVDTLFYVVPNSEVDLQFLYGAFQCIDWGSKNQATGLPSLTQRAISTAGVRTPPTSDEQHAIGSFFDDIDTSLQNQQTRLTQLRHLKQTMLAKMFPRNGETVPGIRLDGFDGEWEFQQIRSTSNTTFGGGTPSSARTEFWAGNLPWIQTSDVREEGIGPTVAQKFINEEAIRSSAAVVIPPRSIAVVIRVGVGKVTLMPHRYATSQDFISLSELKGEPAFLALVIKQRLSQIIHQLQGSTIKGITKKELLSQFIPLPPTLDEQRAIGTYFIKLDELIELEEFKLTKIQQLKNSFLEKMFMQGRR